MSSKVLVRWYHVAPAVLALVLLGAWAAWSARKSQPTHAPESAVQGRPEAVIEPFLPPGAFEGGEAIDFPRQAVTLYWPRADGRGLEAVESEIFATQRVTDRAKQVVELLLRGPTVEAADEDPGEEPEVGAEGPEFIPPLPSGTSLRAAFVGDDGTAYLSLSSELTKGPVGGSRRELAAVYSVVNSLVRSLPEIRRVQFLVEGREIESVGGHLDARFPFAFNERVLAPPPKEG